MRSRFINKTKTKAQIAVYEKGYSRTVHVQWTGKVWQDKVGNVYNPRGDDHA